ncbi:MAG: cellulase family glycosylhydrolase, partial [Lachnospiraceae bacterium]|nr:cellulase family glycosylhydrolase [Lachnospiraceae bacterium]
IFQPYTSSWGGWQKNIIKYKDAIKNQDGSYTSYIAVRTIKASMDDGQDCSGINLGFLSSEPTITLTGYYAMTVKATKTSVEKYDTDKEAALTVNEDMIVVTGTQMKEAGVNLSGLTTSTKVAITPYIQVTEAHTKSVIVFSCMNTDASSNSSNKAIIGTGCESSNNGASATNYVIHCGYGTGKEGTGVGAAGTGIYNKIPSIDTGKWSGKTAENISLRLQVRTKDTKCKLLGVVFANGQAFTVNDDGTITNGFNTANIKTESQTPDATDVKPKSEAELKSEAEDELWLQLRKANIIKKEDCLSDELFNELRKAITECQAALDAADATSTSLTAALNKLQNAVKSATNEAPLGLKKAIEYCESLQEEDYSAASFAKLAPAIEAAKAVYEVSGKKTDSELKAARDTLEAVRVALVPKVSDAASNPKDFRILSKKEVVKEMGAGINLGNTMDGGLYTVSETGWQAYKTTKAYIRALHDAGYNTVRIPVTWGENINDDYTIKEAWINRVQEIVDYCVDQDMYAIINIHHDGAANHDDRGNNTPSCWLDTYQWNIEKVYQKYQGVWKTIANRFKDYDEHLIFESMNEVTDAHKLAAGQVNEDDKVLNALNQLFINTVRATGSNNTKRWLAITGRFATTTAITKKPEDTLADMGDVGTTRLMFSVHIYKASTSVRWTYNNLKEWQTSLSNSSKNVGTLDSEMPLYVGEYGGQTKSQSGSETGYNNAERALYYESCAALCDMYGAVPIVWDQGSTNYLGIETQTGLFTDWDRPNLKPVYDDVVFGTIRGTYEGAAGRDAGTIMKEVYKSYGHASETNNDVSKDPVITPATDITLSTTSLSMKSGEWTTVTAEADSARDMVIWSTDDDAVATVSRGLIHAKGIGITTIHAKTQLGDVVKDIKVIVGASGKETATAIKTDKPYYEITEGGTVDIKTTLTPENSKDAVTYISSNTDIATVSSNGKVTGENPGLTYIIVSAASGVSTIVAIKVKKKGVSNAVSATLNLLFGSNITEKSAPVTMTGDGQYTVTYDLATDLSEEGKNANITKLENLTSVYLLDTNTLKPVVSSAKIRYDKIAVNDKELTLKSPEDLNTMWTNNMVETELTSEGCFKNLLKSSGQLDSNDPINAWDGSVVNEITVDSKKHTASFTGIDNPTKISVTFTIKDMKFFPVNEKNNEAEKLDSVTENKFVLNGIGDTKEIELTMTPTDSDSEVTFYSTKSSVVAVNNSKVTVDADGKIRVTVTALSEGTVTLVGITENGLKALYTIGVGDINADDLEEPIDPTPEGLDGSLWEEPPASSTNPPGSTANPPGSTANPPGSTANPPGSTANQPGSTANPPGSTANPPGSTAKPRGRTASPRGGTARRRGG